MRLLATNAWIPITCALWLWVIVVFPVFGEEDVSFYGKRSVTKEAISLPISETPSPVEYHRRVIAPPIPQQPIQKHNMPQKSKSHPPTALMGLGRADQENTAPLTGYILSRNEKLLAKKAQYYFTVNRREATGLWDSVQGYPHATMWDIASGIAATLALEALELKSREEARYELQKTLSTLASLSLYQNELPNREYSTKSAKPSGRLSETISNGNGWSALDIGRLLIWLKITQQRHPSFKPMIDKIINRWQLNRAIHEGTLYGTKRIRGTEYYRQEGRHGYLEYATNGFRLFGYSVPLPNLPQYLTNVRLDGKTVNIDSRNVPFFTSDPYILAHIEFGYQQDWSQLDTIYQLHQNLWQKKGLLTSYAEDAMNKNPWFAYNNLYYYGKAWTSVSPSGKVIENPQIFSHKAGFGFSAIFSDSFSDVLAEKVLKNSLHFRTIPTGEYANGGINTAFNINTNSLILVALWYKASGKKAILDL
ncbi:DUF3131 domain-containing protein [Vibrio sinensis]|uniref:DUF3131 domain-containing protein n=1 Tax=Vibrio sinensis TaxID=2302434 RepID=A0A3A6R3D1_9VIBR|nr:DUF3131 domain-containing protein [Vibrio sinensis]RJX71409.1 DUF3131 domain-containing protein [Vibrio sinensis]